MLKYRPGLKYRGRELRSNMTDAEQKLWFHLRRKQIEGIQFYRQRPVGSYIVDFLAPAANLVIEIDGSQHAEPQHMEYDAKRSAFLTSTGLRVLRFDNLQILTETSAVLQAIHAALTRPK